MTDLAASPRSELDPALGYALWHLDEARSWTLRYVEQISPAALDLQPTGHRHSVSTLLYHIAVFEADWVFVDVLGHGYDLDRRIPVCPAEVDAVLDHPMLATDDTYTIVEGETLETHLRRLEVIRKALLGVFMSMSLTDFRRPRPSGDGTVTPEWVLMHLARHESEHRGQIWVARVAAEEELGESA